MVKKILAILLCSVMILAVSAGCSSANIHLGQASIVSTATTFEKASEQAQTPEVPETTDESSGDENPEEPVIPVQPTNNFDGGSVNVNVTTASIAIDDEGIIKSLKLDKYEIAVEVDKNGCLVGDISTDGVKSAKEMQYEYGLKSASKLSLEWFEQVANFEKWAVGQKVDQLLAMKTTFIDESRPAVPNEPDLNVSVSISVDTFLKAIRAAAIDAGWTENGVVQEVEEEEDEITYSSFFEDQSTTEESSSTEESQIETPNSTEAGN